MANTLKVVFNSDVRGIAKAGDVKKVSPGFARNYLFPRQLAFVATDAALRQWETVKQGTLAKTLRRREGSQAQAQQIEGVTCAIAVKASPEGKLFGSVGRQEIVDALAKQGLKVDKHAVLLPKPIKQVGSSTVQIQLPAGVEAKLTITISPEA